jgi:hypothetical protein
MKVCTYSKSLSMYSAAINAEKQNLKINYNSLPFARKSKITIF